LTRNRPNAATKDAPWSSAIIWQSNRDISAPRAGNGIHSPALERHRATGDPKGSSRNIANHSAEETVDVWIVLTALRRPYTFIVLAIVIAIFGVRAALTTPTDIFPNINIPVIAVVWT
jgi:hypothetical protein